MKFNKTIAAVSLAVSSSGLALVAGDVAPKSKTICLGVYQTVDGSLVGGNCDQSRNNVILGRETLQNGCAEDQIALTAIKFEDDAPWSIRINACLPPNVAQL